MYYQVGDVDAQVDGVPDEESGRDSDDNVSGETSAVLADNFASFQKDI
jgi:hypothetical protein